MSARLLNGVVLVPSVIDACLSCRGNVVPRKLEAYYLAGSHSKNGTSAYLLTDVWYCRRCDKGFVLSAFKQVTDSFNRNWTIKELPAETPSHKENQPQMRQHGSLPSTTPKQFPDAARLKVNALDFILQDHENKCPNCKTEVTKMNVLLQSVYGDRVDYTPCEALKCEICRKWMLRRHHYIKLQTNLQPYIIPLASTAKQRHPSKTTAGKSRNSANSRVGNARNKKPPDLGIPPSERVDPGNRLFNQYGVFLPSPTGRKGYFED